MPRITPRTLKGFRDYLPEAAMPREWIVEKAHDVYRSYGYRPIDTPALEYLEILTGKGSEETDKQLYRFEDHGGRQVGMRFDLTVPLARFVAQHAQELGLPFKRYHIATVWRGENTQAGRYREFMQCDFDTVGTTSLTADIEMALVINDLLSALGIEKFTIRINHRGVLNGLLEKLQLDEQSTAILRALDKLDKIGLGGVAEEMSRTASTSDQQNQQLLALAEAGDDASGVLEGLTKLVAGSEIGELAASDLSELLSAVAAAGVPADRIQLDPSIARGLDYYTGLVVETQLDELPQIGSVCSGGRYDNLAGLYTSQQLPGVGASLGLDRLLAALEQLGSLPSTKTPAPVLICMFEAGRRNDYLKLASQLRSAGVGVEVFPDAKKLGKQLQYADRQGFRAAIVMGSNEFDAGECQVKDLANGGSETVAYADGDSTQVIAELQRLLRD